MSVKHKCNSCSKKTDLRKCSGCERWICDEHWYGPTEEARHDAVAQGRCHECCNDPT